MTGVDFQVEVCTRYASVILSFQTVPAKPQGDAGLDAISHAGAHGYCCYGPEFDGFKNNKARENAIVTKFTADLRRLFELETSRSGLAHVDNAEMGKILPVGQRLAHVKLLVNWFESHRVIGPILTKVAEYARASKCRYVQPDVSVVVIGPKELANTYPIDEITRTRAMQRKFVEKVQAAAVALTISDPIDFDRKMESLRDIRPDQEHAIAGLAEGLRREWRTALAFERELGDAWPDLHRSLERIRGTLALRVSELMLSSPQPWTQLGTAGDLARQALEPDFGRLYGSLVPSVAQGEVARLIGECSIGWKKP